MKFLIKPSDSLMLVLKYSVLQISNDAAISINENLLIKLDLSKFKSAFLDLLKESFQFHKKDRNAL